VCVPIEANYRATLELHAHKYPPFLLLVITQIFIFSPGSEDCTLRTK
jgi:hypothetical protein